MDFTTISVKYGIYLKIRNVKKTRSQAVICKTAFGFNIDISMPVLYVKGDCTNLYL